MTAAQIELIVSILVPTCVAATALGFVRGSIRSLELQVGRLQEDIARLHDRIDRILRRAA